MILARVSFSPLLIRIIGFIKAHPAWTRGITPWIGVKGMIDELRLDMHQRDQVTLALGTEPDKLKAIHHKPFYAAELVLKGVDLRTVLAVFRESLKTEISVATSSSSTCLRLNHLPTKTPLSSSWYNVHDFIELDWTSSIEPTVHYLPFATCPRFAYVKRNDAKTGKKLNSKFGIENTHFCLLEQGPCKHTGPFQMTKLTLAEIKTKLPLKLKSHWQLIA